MVRPVRNLILLHLLLLVEILHCLAVEVVLSFLVPLAIHLVLLRRNLQPLVLLDHLLQPVLPHVRPALVSTLFVEVHELLALQQGIVSLPHRHFTLLAVQLLP